MKFSLKGLMLKTISEGQILKRHEMWVSLLVEGVGLVPPHHVFNIPMHIYCGVMCVRLGISHVRLNS